uniref:RNA-directed DNA polymerase n=1 Tax=Strongyloides stercoralis TaxID=6248 RepID=A0AAF5DFD9_STRER
TVEDIIQRGIIRTRIVTLLEVNCLPTDPTAVEEIFLKLPQGTASTLSDTKSIKIIESIIKDTYLKSTMPANWENQETFNEEGSGSIAAWIESLELRFRLDNLTKEEHDQGRLIILQLKVGTEGRNVINEAGAKTYTTAKEALLERFDGKVSIETAVMKLSMARIDYSIANFGNSLKMMGDLIWETTLNRTSSSRLNVVSQGLVTKLSGHVQRRLMDRLGFYKSLKDLYVDLEFHNQLFVESQGNRRQQFQKKSINRVDSFNGSKGEPLRCHHCNFPGHKKAQCRRFLSGLPKKDYTIQNSSNSQNSFNKLDVPKSTCSIVSPKSSSLLPAIVNLKINGITSKCLIDSGSAISLAHYENMKDIDKESCEFKILGATGTEEVVKSFCNSSIMVGDISVGVPLCLSKSRVVRDKTILGMDFISQLKSTMIMKNGVVLNDHFFPFLEPVSETLSASIDIALERQPVRYLRDTININSVEIPPSAEKKLSNETILKMIEDRFGNEDLVSVFSKDKTDLGHCTITIPYIKFDYRRMMEQAETVIQEMLDSGTIEEGSAKMLHNLIPVRKKDGTIRPTTDMRRSNDAAPYIDYPVHRVDEAIHDAVGGDFYMLCDLVSSYHQFRLHKDNVGDIGIYFNSKTYRYLTLPQGFRLSPQLMQEILDSLAPEGLRWYYDDGILKTVGSLNTHIENVRRVLLMLKKAQLKVSWTKSTLCSDTINYLGHTISKQGFSLSESGSRAIERLKPPSNVNEVRAMLGAVSFYCQFVPEFAKLLSPITRLLKKDVPFSWCNKCQYAFDKLKKGLCSRELLYAEDKNFPLEVYTDACLTGYGGYLAQTVDGKKRVLRYWSKKRTHIKRKRDAMYLEGMAVILFSRRHLNLLMGTRIIWHLDNLPLMKYFSKKLDHHPQLSAWATELAILDIEWKYIPGPSNILADSLSRTCVESDGEEESTSDVDEVSAVCTISKEEVEEKYDMWSRKLKEAQSLEKIVISENRVMLNGLVLGKVKNNLGEKLCPVLPKSLHKEAVQLVHVELGHPGVQRTYLSLLDRFDTEAILNTVREVILQCSVCQISKPSKIDHPKFEAVDIPSRPFTALAGDIWQYRYKNEILSVLNFVDLTSRMWFPFCIPNESSQAIGETMIRELFAKFGFPHTIRFDRQTSLRSTALKSLLSSFGINVEYSSTQHHTGNSIIERAFRTLKQLLKSTYNEYVTSQKSPISEMEYIINNISQIGLKYNSTINTTTGVSPFSVFFMRDSRLASFKPVMDCDNHTSFYSTTSALSTWKRISTDSMENRKEKNGMLANAKVDCPSYSIGDLVLLKNPSTTSKLDTPFVGPFRITCQMDQHLFLKPQENVKGRPRKVHVSQVKPFFKGE